ncbi:basic secretory protein-like protein [Hufsiella ginkgonis]|uniref:Secretory protein n=1 Tax=Hufsiella ginkgonis TaxID=2695274 RepID=A0A7K1Y0I0_9SPHI|nr:basic secretory protein-like protein [Hufsiella ginkgonis]MXV16587.1 secretory protein [Hufsiella ginkgonis]
MIHLKRLLPALLPAILLTSAVHAQSSEVIQKKGYKLTFTNQDATFPDTLKDKLIKTFFEVYPKLAKEYNRQTLKEVTFVIDTAYKGVAATSNGRVVFSSKYMRSHAGDIDVVTHEVMHIVQNYGRSVGPGWLTEGIADFVRYKFGVANPAAKWSLTPYKAGQSYKNSYRITARFLAWIEATKKKGLVKELDKQLRLHTYTAESWTQLTGSALDELWETYIKDPEFKIKG